MPTREHLTSLWNHQSHTFVFQSSQTHARCVWQQHSRHPAQIWFNWFSFTPWYVQSLLTYSTCCTLTRKEGLEGKGPTGCFIFPFSCMTSCLVWVVGRKHMIGSLGQRWSLAWHRLLSASKTSSGSNEVSGRSEQKGTTCISLPLLRVLCCPIWLPLQNTSSKKTKNVKMLTRH